MSTFSEIIGPTLRREARSAALLYAGAFVLPAAVGAALQITAPQRDRNPPPPAPVEKPLPMKQSVPTAPAEDLIASFSSDFSGDFSIGFKVPSGTKIEPITESLRIAAKRLFASAPPQPLPTGYVLFGQTAYLVSPDRVIVAAVTKKIPDAQ